MRQLLFCCGILLIAAQTLGQNFTTDRTAEGIELRENGKKVLFYQVKPKSVSGEFERAGYIHPLYSLKGNSITDDSPEDHPYHRGVFWAWHQIILHDRPLADGWMSQNVSWLPVDVQFEKGDGTGTLQATVLWKSKVDDTLTDIIKETTSIRVHAAEAQYRIIDFDIRLNALVDDLKIGGSDDPKGYGGFCIRLKLPADVAFASGAKVIPQETAVMAAPWMDITGSLEGQSLPKSGVLLFANATNTPQPWILRKETSMQNIPFPGRAPVSLPKTGLQLSYRLIIHDGEMSEAQIKKLYDDYLKAH